MSTINAHIVAGADDVFSYSTPVIFIVDGVVVYTGTGDSTTELFCGLRFQAISLPVGAVISSAVLTVYVASVTGSPDIDIFGNAVANAAVWANPGNLVRNITKTTAVTTKTVWTAAADNTIDVTAQVAEIVALGGWASGNAMAFGLFNGGGVSSLNYISIAALEHLTLTEARLSITYTTVVTNLDGVASTLTASALTLVPSVSLSSSAVAETAQALGISVDKSLSGAAFTHTALALDLALTKSLDNADAIHTGNDLDLSLGHFTWAKQSVPTRTWTEETEI